MDERKKQRAAEASKSFYERADELGLLTLGCSVPQNTDYRIADGTKWRERLLVVRKVRFPRQPSCFRICSTASEVRKRQWRFSCARVLVRWMHSQTIRHFAWNRDFEIDRQFSTPLAVFQFQRCISENQLGGDLRWKIWWRWAKIKAIIF